MQNKKKKEQVSEQAGNVNWKSLDKETKSRRKDDEDGDGYNPEAIKKEVEQLSEDEHSSPYPDEFLADVNMMSREIHGDKPRKLPGMHSDEELQRELGSAEPATSDEEE